MILAKLRMAGSHVALRTETSPSRGRGVTRAAWPAGWAQARRLLSRDQTTFTPSLFLSTSGSGPCVAKFWPICGFCCVYNQSPPMQAGPGCLGPPPAVAPGDTGPWSERRQIQRRAHLPQYRKPSVSSVPNPAFPNQEACCPDPGSLPHCHLEPGPDEYLGQMYKHCTEVRDCLATGSYSLHLEEAQEFLCTSRDGKFTTYWGSPPGYQTSSTDRSKPSSLFPCHGQRAVAALLGVTDVSLNSWSRRPGSSVVS